MIEVHPIGVVKSSVAAARDENWGSIVAELHFDPALAAGLEGLDAFSHLLVFFWMHEATFDPAKDLVRRPRGRQDMPEIGIFAQRARHRPNPIAVTAVKLVDRKGTIVRVQGLDAMDGSPIVDVKPYMPVFDRVEAPVIPPWVERLMVGYF